MSSTTLKMLAAIAVVSCVAGVVYSDCVKVDSCYDRTNKKQAEVGKQYQRGCRTCTCEESKQRVLTCYLDSRGKIPRLPGLTFWRHYYIDVSESQAERVKCPLGMNKVPADKTIYAQFYLSYVKVSKRSVCCDMKPPPVDDLCEAVQQKKDCQFRLVLKSNAKIACPYELDGNEK